MTQQKDLRTSMQKIWVFLCFVVLICGRHEPEDRMQAVYTNTWAVKLEGGASEAKRIAKKHGFTNSGPICLDYYLFTHNQVSRRSSQSCKVCSHQLAKEPRVKWLEQQVKKKRVLLQDSGLSFNDPMWPKQKWYLGSSDGAVGMSVAAVWKQGLTGNGVVVTVVDDGVERSNRDIADNFDAEVSFDVVDDDKKPEPVPERGGHGNRCAGVIAGVVNNRFCGVGISFKSKVGGIRLINENDQTDAMEAKALSYAQNRTDIYSNSWGPADTGWVIDGPGELTRKALQDGVERGREGLGSIYVFAAGNGGVNNDTCAYNGYANAIETIAVSSVNRDGTHPWYAEKCSAILASTYSREERTSQKTDYIVGANKGENGCTDSFFATSASAALASGMFALILEANPKLSWRDLQHIIVRSARTDVPRVADWVTNHAGLKVSASVGFGLLDAAKMVEFAKSWETVPQQIKCEISGINVTRVIPQSEPLRVTLRVSESNCRDDADPIKYLEHVQVRVDINFFRRGYLEMELKSPQGTSSTIIWRRDNDLMETKITDWSFLTVHFWGEDPVGVWELKLWNVFPKHAYNGTLNQWALKIFGTGSDPMKRNPQATSGPSTTISPKSSAGKEGGVIAAQVLVGIGAFFLIDYFTVFD